MRVWLSLLLAVLSGAYLPGVAPRDFEEFAPIELYVDKLDSAETQLPFDYYYLNFCKPDKVTKKTENLGQILQGDRVESSPYEVLMNKNETCKRLCPTKKNSKLDLENFRWMIENEYRSSWIMDNLPAGLRWTRVRENVKESRRYSYYQDGFPIGYMEGGRYYVYNHIHIIVKIYCTNRQDPEVDDSPASTWRVVGFLVDPMSLQSEKGADQCSTQAFEAFIEKTRNMEEEIANPSTVDWVPIQRFTNFEPMELEQHINYTYSVSFEESDTPWASRWDHYLYNGGKESGEVHWLSIVNSFAMVLFLSGMVAHILGRALRKDIARYNEHSDLDDVEETGWKQVHGDVFRTPKYSGIFSLLIGAGVQLIGMCFLTLIFASLGFLSSAHRGGLVTTMLLLFVFMGVSSGFVSARLYKLFGGEHWKRNTLGSAVFLPGACFLVFFVVNLFLWGEGSTGAVPFLHLLSILVLWVGVSVPLIFLGSAIGFKKPPITLPCKVSRIPKPMNLMPGTSKFTTISLMAGSLPFGCMFIELSYIMNSLWHHTLFYYFFGFLFLCFMVLVITSAEVSILLTYILLCK